MSKGKNAEIRGIGEFLIKVFELHMVVANETMHALTYHAQALLKHFLEAATDTHDFADGLHAGADLAAHTRKLREVPARNRTNQVVERRSNVSTVRSSHFANLIESVAEGNLCSHKSKRITGCFTCESRRTGQTSVDLDDAIVVCLCVEGKLDVALAHDIQVTNALDSEFLKHLNLLVFQRTSRSYHNTFACMNAERIEVLHRSDGEAMVVGVADALELNLLPTFEALLNKYLRGESEGTFCNLLESLLVRTNAASQTAKCVSRANHDGIADATGSCDGFVECLASLACRHFQVNLAKFFDEKVAVLGIHNGFDAGAKHFDAILLEHAILVESSTYVQACLSAPSQHDTVRLLLLDDFLYKIRCDGQEVNLVRNAFTGLDSCDVGIDKHRVDALFAESLQGLTAGIVKLASLTNLQRTAA